MAADEGQTTADELPDRWMWTTLGDACIVNPSLSRPESFTEDTPVSFVPMAAVDDVTGAIVAAEPRPIGKVWQGYKRFAEGDVIFARITPCMENGKAAIATGLTNGIGLGSTEFHVLRPTEAVSAEWVYYFVRQQSFRNDAVREMTGTAGQLRVPRTFMEGSPIPLAPLPEQRRIVAKIEALFRESRRAREALDRVSTLIGRFRQSVLAAAFRGDLTERDPGDEPASALLARIQSERRRRWEEDLRVQGKDPCRQKYDEPALPDTSDLPELPERWVWVRYEALIHFITSGSRGWAKYYADSGPLFLRVGNLNYDSIHLDLSEVVSVNPPNGAEKERTRVQPDDILIAITGNTIGKVALVPCDFSEAYINQHIALTRLVTGLGLNFIAYYLAAREGGQKQILDTQYGMTKPGLSLTDVRNLCIPLAPLAEQQRIVARIEALFAQADAVEAAVAAARQRLDRLDQATLARAFRGELVPQDPDDEPASALLARVREGQAKRQEEG